MTNNEYNTREIGPIRQILRHEITWFVFLIGFLWSFVATVVLPIQQLQFQIAQIQKDLSSEIINYQRIEARITEIEREHAVLENKLK